MRNIEKKTRINKEATLNDRELLLYENTSNY